jgi:RNA polymerase sigma-70 factor (ECF subfamily)
MVAIPERISGDQSPDSSDLVLARNGDRAAFGRLFEAVRPQLRGYLRALCAPDEVDDVVSDVALRAFGSINRFDGDDAKFRSWIFTIAHHRAVDMRRKLRRSEPLTASHTARMPGGNAESDAMSRLGAVEIHKVLRILSPLQRQVLMLRVVADLSVEETAAIVGKRPETVRVLQHRALKSVRKRIEEDV